MRHIILLYVLLAITLSGCLPDELDELEIDTTTTTVQLRISVPYSGDGLLYFPSTRSQLELNFLGGSGDWVFNVLVGDSLVVEQETGSYYGYHSIQLDQDWFPDDAEPVRILVEAMTMSGDSDSDSVMVIPVKLLSQPPRPVPSRYHAYFLSTPIELAARLQAYGGEIAFEFQYYTNDLVDTVTILSETNTTTLSNDLAIGRYNWRVRVLSDSGDFSPWSEATPFDVCPIRQTPIFDGMSAVDDMRGLSDGSILLLGSDSAGRMVARCSADLASLIFYKDLGNTSVYESSAIDHDATRIYIAGHDENNRVSIHMLDLNGNDQDTLATDFYRNPIAIRSCADGGFWLLYTSEYGGAGTLVRTDARANVISQHSRTGWALESMESGSQCLYLTTGATFRAERINSDSSSIWVHSAFAGNVRNSTIAVYPDGGSILGGTVNYRVLLYRLDIYGSRRWEFDSLGVFGAGGSSLCAIEPIWDGGAYVLCNGNEESSAGYSDIYLLKLDIDGNLVWVKSYGDCGISDYPTTLFADGERIVVAGMTSSESLIFIELDLDGRVIFQ